MAKLLAEAPIVELDEADIWNGSLPGILARQAQEHGSVLRLTLAGQPRAVEVAYLVGPEANKLVFHTRREAFSHDKGWTPMIGELLGRGLLNMDGAEWAAHRKLWNPAFTQAYMERYLPLMQQIIAERTARWPERETVDVYQEAREITFDVAASALAGVRRGPESERLQQLFYTLLTGGSLDLDDFEEYVRRATAARAELDEILLKLIAQRRAEPEEAHRDVLGLIVHARDERGQTLSDEQVMAHLNILLVAGHETTTVLSAFTLYRLTTEREQRARVEAELDEFLGVGSAPLMVDAARRLRILDNFVKETGRLHPPVFNVPRGVVEEVEFAGYTLPVGTQVRLALAATHMLPSVFAHPDVFDPDRFAPPREEDKATPYSLVTFGGGSRLCIGINFANIEVKALAAHILRTYSLEAMQEQPPQQVGLTATVLPGGAPLRVRTRS
ncbi:MAG TPA: cytochrome P450 [Ktedonobacterales bacterium]